MSTTDALQRFIFEQSDLRGQWVRLEKTYQEVLSHNPYPPALQKLLGEFLAAVSLLSSTLKFDGTIVLQARGEGLISTIMAECSHHKNLRAIIRLNTEAEINDELLESGGFHELLGKGVLVISIEPKRSENFGGRLERYQGIVPLEKPTLAECLEDYFTQSEQLATRIWLAVDDYRCGGLFIQALPSQINTDPESSRDQWETITALASTLTDGELLQLESAQLLHRLFHEHPLRLFDAQPMQFRCSCSRDRSADALMTIGKEEVGALLMEQGGIDIDCQFCNQHYHFNAAEVRKLLGGTTLH
jgi:molecular chaperone Hsp33